MLRIPILDEALLPVPLIDSRLGIGIRDEEDVWGRGAVTAALLTARAGAAVASAREEAEWLVAGTAKEAVVIGCDCKNAR